MPTIYLSNKNNKFYLYPNDNCTKFEVDKITKIIWCVKFAGGKAKTLLNDDDLIYLNDIEKDLEELFFNLRIFSSLRKIIREKLKTYVGFYKYNFRKIKDKYKKIKIKIIQDYFWNKLFAIRDGVFFDFANKCGWFLPFDLERLFIDFICSNKSIGKRLYYSCGVYIYVSYINFMLFKPKKYQLVDVFQ